MTIDDPTDGAPDAPTPDPLDARIREARPLAPPRLAGEVRARLGARRRRRAAAVGGALVLAAAAVIALSLRPGGGDPARIAPQQPAVASRPPLDASSAPAADAAAPPTWADPARLLDAAEAAHGAEILACAPPGRAVETATFRTERVPERDGHARTFLVIHHSLGYLGYSAEERCLQKVADRLALPDLPAGLQSVSFRLAGPTRPTAGGTSWQDPVAFGRDLLAGARATLAGCLRGGSTAEVTAVFERVAATRGTGAPVARVRLVVGSQAIRPTHTCPSGIAEAIVVPELPAHVDQIVLTVPLGP